MIVKGGLESRSLRVNIFREISVSRQRGCDEGIDCVYMDRFLPNWVINMKRDYRAETPKSFYRRQTISFYRIL